MLDEIVKLLKAWKENVSKEIELKNIYLFGSSIYREGVLFDPAISDLDIVVILPTSVNTPTERKNWIAILKKHKIDLEKSILILLGKKDDEKETVSIVPLTERELNFDIHKSCARNFFRTNDFYDIEANKIISGSSIVNYIELKNELAIQVLESIQKKRNLFLKNTSIKDLEELNWTGGDVLPKDLSRESAKIHSMSNGIKIAGDQFNLSFGIDFLKSYLLKNIDNNKDYAELYSWIDARTGGRSQVKDKNTLSSELHLLLYEILYDLAIVSIDASLIEQAENDKLNEEFLNNLKLSDEHTDFLQNSGLLTKVRNMCLGNLRINFSCFDGRMPQPFADR